MIFDKVLAQHFSDEPAEASKVELELVGEEAWRIAQNTHKRKLALGQI
jgi:hypothetical protein